MTEHETLNPRFKELRQTEFIGNSPAFLRLVMDIFIRSKDEDPVLIIGPTGSGKTGAARVLHLTSPRRDKPFGEFNCAEFASADPLVVMGKLFGYGKNSGLNNIPKEGQKGLLEEYENGTLFFDEVEIIPPQVQQLLLLPLEGRAYNPAAGIGTSKICRVRFIFASNTQLTDELNSGSLRRDFYRRIVSRSMIVVPSLKERKTDIDLLANHFLKLWNEQHDKSMTLSKTDLENLQKMDFSTHDVSQLKATIMMAADHAHFGEKINLEQVPAQIIAQDSIGSRLDPDETRELEVLRRHNFNFGRAEIELGYSSKAKTLTNHFRGLCYKLLAQHQGGGINENVFAEIAAQIAGPDAPPELIYKITRKVTRHYYRLTAKDKNMEHLLYNLAQKYEPYVRALSASVRPT